MHSRSLVNEKEFHRCKCFHVVPLTFTLGFIKVVVYTVVIVLICTMLMKPELLEKSAHHEKMFGCLCKHKVSKVEHTVQEKVIKGSNNDIAILLKIERSETHEVKPISSLFMKEKKRAELNWALFMTSIYLIFSLMLLHGIITKNASNILPFFCLQLFDFFLELLWLFGHLISTREFHKLEMEFNCMPLAKYLSGMDPAVVSFVMMMLFALILVVELYLIGVVWSCYRYIMLSRCQILPMTATGCSRSNGSQQRNGGFWGLELWQVIQSPDNKQHKERLKKLDECEELLPKYEEVLKTPINKFNPPPYSNGQLTEENKKTTDGEDNQNAKS